MPVTTTAPAPAAAPSSTTTTSSSSTTGTPCCNKCTCHQQNRPRFAHVNMQLDTYLANSDLEDLRAIVRGLLATGPQGTTTTFTSLARTRIRLSTPRKLPPSSTSLFTNPPNPYDALPTKALFDTLARARSLFGTGLAFESLPILIGIIRKSIPLRWEVDGELEDVLAMVDADIAQALQSCREELTNPELMKNYGASGEAAEAAEEVEVGVPVEGTVEMGLVKARVVVEELRKVVDEDEKEVERWGGEFPFEKTQMSLDGWKF